MPCTNCFGLTSKDISPSIQAISYRCNCEFQKHAYAAEDKDCTLVILSIADFMQHYHLVNTPTEKDYGFLTERLNKVAINAHNISKEEEPICDEHTESGQFLEIFESKSGALFLGGSNLTRDSELYRPTGCMVCIRKKSTSELKTPLDDLLIVNSEGESIGDYLANALKAKQLTTLVNADDFEINLSVNGKSVHINTWGGEFEAAAYSKHDQSVCYLEFTDQSKNIIQIDSQNLTHLTTNGSNEFEYKGINFAFLKDDYMGTSNLEIRTIQQLIDILDENHVLWIVRCKDERFIGEYHTQEVQYLNRTLTLTSLGENSVIYHCEPTGHIDTNDCGDIIITVECGNNTLEELTVQVHPLIKFPQEALLFGFNNN